MPDSAILLITAGLIWLCIWRSRPRLAGVPVMLAGLLIYAAARPPDVLVSPDARLIAIRDGPTVFLVRQRQATAFTLAEWAPVWPGTPLTPAQCSENTCLLGGVLLALTPPPDCAGAVLAVSPEPLRGACAGLAVIDRFSVYHDGATEAWVNGNKVRLRTDRQVQGDRPWVLKYP